MAGFEAGDCSNNADFLIAAAATKNTPELDRVRWIVGGSVHILYFLLVFVLHKIYLYILIRLVIQLKCHFKTRIL